MRLLCTLHDQKKAESLSHRLKLKGIENQLDIAPNTDWGSNDYGTVSCLIWVIEEDQFEPARQIYDEFTSNPEGSLISITPTAPQPNPLKQIRLTKQKPVLDTRPIGSISLYIIALCTLLLFFSDFSAPKFFVPAPGIPYTPLFSAPIKKQLLFDYPKAFSIIDQIAKAYGPESLADPATLPEEGQVLLRAYETTPYWFGAYQLSLDAIQHEPIQEQLDAPLFEKIREGELWRFVTPAFLHANLFHLLFNMIWVIVLGKQMEERIGVPKYLVFILATAAVSNTAQYLMSGANFLGFSGVICGMLTFVWVRQRKAPWEGYQLQSATMGFTMLFIFGLFGMQFISFLLEAFDVEIFGSKNISISIANTAHLSGAAFGWILGHINSFSTLKKT